jgi:cytochrome c-type biogenesis protein CcmH/NrfG
MKKHYILLLAGFLLLLLMYFGFSIKSKQSKQAEQSRSLVAEVLSEDNVIRSAKERLDDAQLKRVEQMEQRLRADEVPSVDILKELASFWYSNGFPGASGVYAEKIAEIQKDASSWSICGTTYVLAIQNEADEKLRQFSAGRSRKAFEKAISLEPDNLTHRVNLALSFVEMPPEDNPMKGILMLRELNEANPENVTVLFNLARLAVKTGQFDRASERLEQALQLEPDNRVLNCLAAEVFATLGKEEKAQQALIKCERN